MGPLNLSEEAYKTATASQQQSETERGPLEAFFVDANSKTISSIFLSGDSFWPPGFTSFSDFVEGKLVDRMNSVFRKYKTASLETKLMYKLTENAVAVVSTTQKEYPTNNNNMEYSEDEDATDSAYDERVSASPEDLLNHFTYDARTGPRRYLSMHVVPRSLFLRYLNDLPEIPSLDEHQLLRRLIGDCTSENEPILYIGGFKNLLEHQIGWVSPAL